MRVGLAHEQRSGLHGCVASGLEERPRSRQTASAQRPRPLHATRSRHHAKVAHQVLAQRLQVRLSKTPANPTRQIVDARVRVC